MVTINSNYAFAVIFLITTSVAIVRTAPIARDMIAFCTKPAIIYITKDIAATVIA